MAGDQWPDPDAEFALPDSAQGARWQTVIERALLDGSLVLHELSDGELLLEGACPRCGHRLRPRSLTAEAVDGARAIRVLCDCDHAHRGRGGDTQGCGWAPDLCVAIANPVTLPDI